MRYGHILNSALANPWSIQEDHLRMMARMFASRVAGHKAAEDDEDLLYALDEDMKERPAGAYMVGGVGILPLFGPIFPRSNMMTQISGATSIDTWIRAFNDLANDDQVQAIVIDADSPGGSVSGVPEAAERMQQIGAQKPVVAVSNYLMASAAYWVCSQADQIVAAPSSMTGSIGVLAVHESIAQALEDKGVDVTIIKAGRYKAEANDMEPLDDEAEAEIQRVVDEYYAMFVAAVARGRHIPEATVRNGLGEGRALPASRALAQGLVDKIETIEAVVARLQRPQARTAVMRNRARAEDDALRAPISSNPDTGQPELAAFRLASAADGRSQDAVSPPNPEDIAAALERRMKEPAHV